MGANQRALAALAAMESFGFRRSVVKSALKTLLKDNDNNWDYVETSNYSVLVDCILSRPSDEAPPAAARVKVKLENDGEEVSASPLKKPKLELEVSPAPCSADPVVDYTGSEETVEEAPLVRYRRGKLAAAVTDNLICCRDPMVEDIRDEEKQYRSGSPQFEPPLAVIHPPHSDHDQTCQDGLSNGIAREDADVDQVAAGQLCTVDVASSALGEVKISLECYDRPGFRMPSMEDLLREVENRCLRTYKIIEPSFSLANVMKEMCQCALEMGSESNGHKGNIVNVIPMLDSKKTSGLRSIPGISSNGSLDLQLPEYRGIKKVVIVNMNEFQGHEVANEHQEAANKVQEAANGSQKAGNDVSNSLVVVHPTQLPIVVVRPSHDFTDISRGEEKYMIRVADPLGNGRLLPHFYYIPNNIVYRNAKVNFSLARIGDEDCCLDCFGDCLAAPIPCICALVTGGEFAYTQDGCLKQQFLAECISMKQNPEKHNRFYCKRCILERIKNDVEPDPCKGHLINKFVKECWSKCGCSKKCGNRVVQRGMAHNLEVFFTGESKGWGLRSLVDLQPGAFVCEYVGEILTNVELYDRTLKNMGNARHIYPVLLDTNWGSKGAVDDEDALSLDATFYGNVARFVNHRCHDANLIEIPVEVETPDHNYYHLALFTTRRVEAFEELTWDYGMNFDDHQRMKGFRCHCGSTYCRYAKSTQNGSPLVK